MKPPKSDEDHYRALLATYRANLAHYERQAEAYGGLAFAPTITRHGLEESQREIARLEQLLARSGGNR